MLSIGHDKRGAVGPGATRAPQAACLGGNNQHNERTGDNMKKNIVIVLSILIASICTAYAGELRQSGKCTIKEPKNLLDRESITSVTLKNSDLQIVCKLHSGKFVNEYALHAVPWITNLAGNKASVSYHAAFFDKGGKSVASVAQNADFPAAASGYQLGSSITMIPKTVVEKIASYQIVIYTPGS